MNRCGFYKIWFGNSDHTENIRSSPTTLSDLSKSIHRIRLIWWCNACKSKSEIKFDMRCFFLNLKSRKGLFTFFSTFYINHLHYFFKMINERKNSIRRLYIFKLSTQQFSVPFQQKTGAAGGVWFWTLLMKTYIIGVIHINLCHRFFVFFYIKLLYTFLHTTR